LPAQEYEVIFTTYELLEGSLKYQVLRWSVWRRFSEFAALDAALRKQYGYQCEKLGLPPKQFFSSKDPDFILERRRGLHAYMQRTLGTVHGVADFGSHLASAALRDFMQWDQRLQLLKAGSSNASVLVSGAGPTGGASPVPAAPRSTASAGSAGVAASSTGTASPAAAGGAGGSSPAPPTQAAAAMRAQASQRRMQSRSAIATSGLAHSLPSAPVVFAPVAGASTPYAPMPLPSGVTAAPAPAPAPARPAAAPAAAPAPAPAATAAPRAAAVAAPAPAPAAPPPALAAALPPPQPGRGGLLDSIRSGAKLKKAVTVDKSGPKV
jgi:hypothetical protein